MAVFLLAARASADPTIVDVPPGLQPNAAIPKDLEGIGIEDKPGADLPQNLVFHDQTGREVTLGSYLDGTHPLVLVMAYYECPMLCSIVLNAVMQASHDVDWTIGKEFRVVTVSFDKRDDVAAAMAKRKAYVEAYGRPIPDERGWDFLIGDEQSSRALADAIGFHYRWNPDTNQFAHAAGAFVFTPAGKLSRTLWGIQFPPRDFRLALVEASEGKLGTAWDKVLLFCFHYDPNGKGYSLAIMKLLRIFAGSTIIILGAVLLRFWRRERRRSRPGPPVGHLPGNEKLEHSRP